MSDISPVNTPLSRIESGPLPGFVVNDDASVTFTDPDGRTWVATSDQVREHRARVQSRFEILRKASDLLDKIKTAVEETESDLAREAALRAAVEWTPAALGFGGASDADGRWCLTDGSDTTVSYSVKDEKITVAVHHRNSAPVVLESYIYGSGWSPPQIEAPSPILHGVNRPSWSGEYSDMLSEIAGEPNPLAGLPTDLDEAMLFVVAHADKITDRFARLTAVHVAHTERIEAEKSEKDEIAREWRRKSRSKDRIPNKPLTDAAKAMSNINYAREGYPTDGIRVDVVGVVSEKRPAVLEETDIWYGGRRSRRRGDSAPGLNEIFYVVRLEKNDAGRSRRRASYSGFYESDIERLHKALPGCVIKAPEGSKVVFVAVDTVEHVETLNATLAEYVLLGEDSD